MHHSSTIKVRGYHCDFYGHVNNARYLEFLEEARWAYLEEGLDLEYWHRRGLGFVVVSITIDYRRAVGPNTVLQIDSHLKSLGGKSGVIHQEIREIRDIPAGGQQDARPGGPTVAQADITFAVIDLKTGSAVPFTGEVLEALRQSLQPAAGDAPRDDPPPT